MIISRAQGPDEMDEVRRLFREYAEFLSVDLCFQGFEKELASLPGKYAPPEGVILIAREGQGVAGCVALRKIEEGICEMKRLYVRPQFKGQGIGRALAERVICEAKKLGYKSIRLDTLKSLKEAMSLYESLGFNQIKPYYANPFPEVVYLELDLERAWP